MIDPLELARKLARIFPNCEVGDLAAHVIRREEGIQQPSAMFNDFCAACNKRIHGGENYCPWCGTRLNWPGGEA